MEQTLDIKDLGRFIRLDRCFLFSLSGFHEIFRGVYDIIEILILLIGIILAFIVLLIR